MTNTQPNIFRPNPDLSNLPRVFETSLYGIWISHTWLPNIPGDMATDRAGETSPLLGAQQTDNQPNGRHDVENSQNGASPEERPKPTVNMRLFLPAVGIGVRQLLANASHLTRHNMS